MSPTALLTTLAQTAAETGSTDNDDISPIVAGVGAFILLALLLVITLQFNKDR
jgi:hypothetical protein